MAAVMIALQHKSADGLHGVRGSEERERLFMELDDDSDSQEGFTMRQPKFVGSLDKLVLSATVKEDGSPFSWQPRGVMLDDHVIAFTNIGEKRIIDYIPLEEVRAVQRLDDVEQRPSATARASQRGQAPQRGQPGAKYSFLRKGSTGQTDLDAKSGIENTPYTRAFSTEVPRAEADRAFEILTIEHGHNSGRSYRLRAESQYECDLWIERIKHEVRVAQTKNTEEVQQDRLTRLREWLDEKYRSERCQIVISFLILVNFIVSVSSTEILPPDGSLLERIFETLEDVFTIIFLVELLINLFINWFFPFFNDLWNIFDLLVISGSILTMFLSGPGLAIIRLVRIFRVLRVIKRLYALRRIINALTKSMVPMVNAFTVLFLVASIYSTLAVILYREKSPVLFGSFSAAFFTMFQVCTMDDWGETARSLSEDRTVDLATGIFFVSFVILVGIVILNVVVAVLLDEFVESVTEDREQRINEMLTHRQERQKTYGGPLDPVLDTLAHYNTSIDLSTRIATLFQALDIDRHGALSFRDLKDGLRKLKTEPHIHLSEEDFNVITYDKAWCNRKGLLGQTHFERVMRDQLKLYVQRQMARSMVAARCSGSQVADILFVLKQLMVSVDDLHASHGAFRRGDASPISVQPQTNPYANGSPRAQGNPADAFGSVGPGSNLNRTVGPAVARVDSYVVTKLDEVVELLSQQGQAISALCERVDAVAHGKEHWQAGRAEFKLAAGGSGGDGGAGAGCGGEGASPTEVAETLARGQRSERQGGGYGGREEREKQGVGEPGDAGGGGRAEGAAAAALPAAQRERAPSPEMAGGEEGRGGEGRGAEEEEEEGVGGGGASQSAGRERASAWTRSEGQGGAGSGALGSGSPRMWGDVSPHSSDTLEGEDAVSDGGEGGAPRWEGGGARRAAESSGGARLQTRGRLGAGPLGRLGSGGEEARGAGARARGSGGGVEGEGADVGAGWKSERRPSRRVLQRRRGEAVEEGDGRVEGRSMEGGGEGWAAGESGAGVGGAVGRGGGARRGETGGSGTQMTRRRGKLSGGEGGLATRDAEDVGTAFGAEVEEQEDGEKHVPGEVNGGSGAARRNWRDDEQKHAAMVREGGQTGPDKRQQSGTGRARGLGQGYEHG